MSFKPTKKHALSTVNIKLADGRVVEVSSYKKPKDTVSQIF
jgi:hypothetical protein